MTTGIRSTRLQTRKVDPSELLPEDVITNRGFAGHTIEQYPEPCRSYNIAFGRLEHVWEQIKVRTPLLMYVRGDLVGVMNSIWSSRVGYVPVKRMNQSQLEVLEEKAIFLIGDDIKSISFAVDEVLLEIPRWCK